MSLMGIKFSETEVNRTFNLFSLSIPVFIVRKRIWVTEDMIYSELSHVHGLEACLELPLRDMKKSRRNLTVSTFKACSKIRIASLDSQFTPSTQFF